MQSGISVSQELYTAFNKLVSSPSERGLVATIQKESIVPQSTLPSSSGDFFNDLGGLSSLLTTSQAAYIILRRHDSAADAYVAVTYVPDAAPVRQKTLLASTRLTLVRELGTERFREQLFVTELSELAREGWKRHETSTTSQAPLTAEEETLQGVKDAEAQARGGTAGNQLETGGKLNMAIDDSARSALVGLKDSSAGTLVQLVNYHASTRLSQCRS